MNNLLKTFERNKKQLLFVILCTFFWGLLAHGYGFMQNSFSHDSLNEFNGADGSNLWKIQLGRFCIPLYKAIFRTDLTLPWLVGLLSLVWIGLTVFSVVRIFRIESKPLVFLIAGIFTANITVAATAATYMHDYDCDMFALLCAVMAVYFWKNVRRGGIFGAICISISLGIYQSYFCVTIVLVMFVCILDLLNGESFKNVFNSGLRAIGMLLLGCVLYGVAMKLALTLAGTTLASGDYNSLGIMLELTPRSILSLIFYAYKDCISRLFSVASPYPAALIQGITWLILLILAGIMLYGIGSRRIRVPEKLLCIGLVCLLPLGMNLMYVLTTGVVHDLMVYAVWLVYLLVLLLTNWLTERWKGNKKLIQLKSVCMALILVLLYSNVQTANAMYLKKDMEQDAFLSFMTRVLYRIENYEGYEPGITPVVFVGNSDQLCETIPGFERYCRVTGLSESVVTGLTEDFRARSYFAYVLNNPALIPGGDVWYDMQTDSRAAEMPNYPADGCIAMIDGVLVVKLGDVSY